MAPTCACPPAPAGGAPEMKEAPTQPAVEASVLTRRRLQELHQLRALGLVLVLRQHAGIEQLLDLLQALSGAARVTTGRRRRSLGSRLGSRPRALLLLVVVHEHLG